MRRRSLGVRVALAFAVVAIATALIAAVVLTVTWQRQFSLYIQRGVQERADAVATVLSDEYARAGSWDRVSFFQLTHFGLIGGLDVRVLDADGDVVAYTAGPMGGFRTEGDPDEGVDVTARSEVVHAGEVVGRVLVTQPAASGQFTERDQWFRRSSILGLMLAAAIAVVLASLAGALYSRGIVEPIEAVTRVADRIRRGDRGARTGMTGGDPVSDLGQTLDRMADAVEAERRFEQQLTADVAHELRTPLQAIQATVEGMQDGVLPTDEERLGLIHDETVRLGRLAGSILELSRLETGSAPFMLGPIDVAVPVGVALDASRALMESTGHTLLESLESGAVVNGDGDRITQAVGNLLANAARYTPTGGVVRVRVLRDGADAVIEVADSGIGVAEGDRPHVFTRFWRADPARSRASGGLGIGLAVVREIAERQGGSVGVYESELGGASFVIRLPLVGPSS